MPRRCASSWRLAAWHEAARSRRHDRRRRACCRPGLEGRGPFPVDGERNRFDGADAVSGSRAALEPGHFLQPLRPGLGPGSRSPPWRDPGGDGAARLVAVCAPAPIWRRRDWARSLAGRLGTRSTALRTAPLSTIWICTRSDATSLSSISPTPQSTSALRCCCWTWRSVRARLTAGRSPYSPPRAN